MSQSRETFQIPNAAPLTYPPRDPGPEALALFLRRARAVLVTWRLECRLLEAEAVLLLYGLPALGWHCGHPPFYSERDGWLAHRILMEEYNRVRDAVVRVEGYCEEAEGGLRETVTEEYAQFRLRHAGRHR